MSFILGEQRDVDCLLAFELYRKYLNEFEWKFPPSAYALASSDWWYDCHDKRCPHDGRVQRVEFREIEIPNERNELEISISLAGAWGGESHEIVYSGVTDYHLSSAKRGSAGGRSFWRYDEFQISDGGQLRHEIEWGDDARWEIQCRDIQHRFSPDSE